MKKRLIFALICTLLTGVLVGMMVFPRQKTREYIHNDNDIVAEYTDNKVYEDDAIIYNITSDIKDVQSISFELKNTVTSIALFSVYVDYGEGYTEKYKYNLSVPKQENVAYIKTDFSDIKSVKVVEDIEYPLSGIQLHSDLSQVTEKRVSPYRPLLYLAVIFEVIVFILSYIVQWRFNVLDRISSRIKKAKSGNKSIRQTKKRCIVDKIDKIILSSILLIGSAIILITPVSHNTWDIDSHYRWALIDSYLGRACLTQADLDFFYVNETSLLADSAQESRINQKKLNSEYNYVVANDYEVISLPHMPSGIAMAVVRWFGGSFIAVFKAGEFANLIVYAILCYLGLRKLKSGKLIFSIIALFPTSLMMATNYSYDYWVIAFSMLGMAYFIGNCQHRDSYISTKDTIIMVGALALACLPKQIYVPIMLIPFFMPHNKIENKKKYYAICLLGFAVLLGSFIIRAIGSTGGSGDSRGGAVSPGDQIQYMLSSPGSYIQKLLDFLADYLSILMVKEFTLDFAYFGMGNIFIHLITILLIVAALLDKDECDDYKTGTIVRIYSVLVYVGVAALVATAMYISYTEVGASEIAGCQARYLIPLVYPLAAVIGSPKIRNKINRNCFYGVVLGVDILVVCINIYDVVLKMYI